MDLHYFNKYRHTFNKKIEEVIKKYSISDYLTEMIMYSLEGGKRLRPIITIDICNSLCENPDSVILFSISLELIHSACLIIDDLPCMDNDDFRRGKLSFHKKYSITQSQLVSAELINIAFRMIIDNFKNNNNFDYIIENVSKNLGILGAAGGQFIDLNPVDIFKNKKELKKKFKNKEIIKELFYKKTTTFFEIGFVGGYLGGGGGIENINILLEAAYYFGLAFQIYDDFDDIEQDKIRIDNGFPNPNYIGNFGKEDAYNTFNNSINLFKINMNKINLYSNTIDELLHFLMNKVNNKYKNL